MKVEKKEKEKVYKVSKEIRIAMQEVWIRVLGTKKPGKQQL